MALEIRLRGSESNDLTPRRAQESDHCPKGQTGDLEIRADRGFCRRETARTL